MSWKEPYLWSWAACRQARRETWWNEKEKEKELSGRKFTFLFISCLCQHINRVTWLDSHTQQSMESVTWTNSNNNITFRQPPPFHFFPPSFSTIYPATCQLLPHTLPAPCPPQHSTHTHVPCSQKCALANRCHPTPQGGTWGLDACPHVLGVHHNGQHCTGGTHSMSCRWGQLSRKWAASMVSCICTLLMMSVLGSPLCEWFPWWAAFGPC